MIPEPGVEIHAGVLKAANVLERLQSTAVLLLDQRVKRLALDFLCDPGWVSYLRAAGDVLGARTCGVCMM